MPPDLLLLPGLLNDDTVWRHQRRGLADCAGIHVAAYGDCDNIGEIAAQVLAGAPETFLLAGFSMGGYVAMEMLAREPERIKGLALVATSARADTVEQRVVRQQVIDAVQRGKFDKVVAATSELALHGTGVAVDAARAQMVEMARAIGPERFSLHMRAVMNRRDLRMLLPSHQEPGLVVMGERDRVMSNDHSRELAVNLPRVEELVVAECGHMVPLQAAESLSLAMRRWLESASM
ncbi:MAG: alpha/beta fold hydrolase [Parahaliea sp.]